MRTFRNRLLILIIGLVVGAQVVTLVAALAHTAVTTRDRAEQQLEAGTRVARQLITFRGTQLANAVTVLAADYGLREAVASGDRGTIESAVDNHGRRIGAQLKLVYSADGALLAASDGMAVPADAVRALTSHADGRADAPHFLSVGRRVYQVFTAPVNAPDLIGWVALGFELDERLAQEIRDLVDVEVTLLDDEGGRARLVASTVPVEFRAEQGVALTKHPAAAGATVTGGGEGAYLTAIAPLGADASGVSLALQKSLREVNRPYRELALALALIAGATLLGALAAGWILGRNAMRPIGALVDGARRIQRGDYGAEIHAGGGAELETLARTFNGMQAGIAEREARIVHQAYHDALTSLPNRRLAEQWIDATLAHDRPDRRVAVATFAFANLRQLSATLGFAVADAALCELGRRLAAALQPGEFLARLDGPTFLVAIGGMDASAAAARSDALAAGLRATVRVQDVVLQPQVAAGLSHGPAQGEVAAELLRRAEAALDVARRRGSGTVVFEPASDDLQRRRLRLGTELPEAIASGQLSLVYQPKVSMASRRVQSAEVLTRWTHPVLGPIPALEFVQVAEQTGSSGLLLRWVLGAALDQLRSWRTEGFALDLAVNLSAADVADPALPDDVLAALAARRLPADALILEITESAFMHEVERATANVERLRVAGVRFSIDDFGTGYSSLAQLRRLPVDELKIDRSFVADAASDPDDAAVVRLIVELGRSLGLRVVAEGVETEASWRLLNELGCDFAQGYMISRPLPAAEFARRARELNAELPFDPTQTAVIHRLQRPSRSSL